MMMTVLAAASGVVSPLLDLELREFAVAVLRTAGPFCFMGMQISSLQTGIMIAKERSVGDLSPIPFLSLLMNGSVWFIYGSVKCDWTILVPNFTAVLVGATCVSLYHINSKGKVSVSLYGMVFSVIASSMQYDVLVTGDTPNTTINSQNILNITGHYKEHHAATR